MSAEQTQFSALLKEAFSCPQKEIDAFFQETFVTPIVNQLASDETKPAESFRAKLQQTTHIKQILINLAKKNT